MKAFENYPLIFETEVSDAFDNNASLTVAPVKSISVWMPVNNGLSDIRC